VFSVSFTAGTPEPVKVQTITVTASGSGNEVSDVTAAFLYHDSDGNGAFDSSTDLLRAGPIPFLADNGRITIPAHLVVPPGGTESFFVVYNFTDNVPVGSTFSLSITADSDVTAEGVNTGLPASTSGAPLTGGTLTVAATTEPEPFMGCSAGNTPAGPAGPLSLLLLLAGFLAVSTVWRKTLAKQ
jgi:hypothetical protein